MMRNRWLTRLTPFLVLMLLATACSFGAKSENRAIDEQSTLKVMYYDEKSFFQQYGMLFSATHPSIDIEVVKMDRLFQSGSIENFNQTVLELIEEEQPDVVMLQPDQYKSMVQEGLLYDLTTLVNDDAFESEGIMPGLLDYMGELGDGKIYGLSPEFYGEVVYYNKDLFEQYGVPLPEDQMTWEELLTLAQRFPTDGGENRVYGLKAGYNGSVAELAVRIASTHGLSFVDPADSQVLIDTEAWKSAFQTALDAYQSGSLYSVGNDLWGGGDSYEDYLMSDPFIGGRVAMTIDAHFMINQLESARDYLQDKGIQNWDMVTLPIDPNNPEVSTQMRLNNIFAIHANSVHIEAAEQFIRYLHSDDYARIVSKSYLGSGLPIRTKYIDVQDDRNIQAFYKLKPALNPMYEDLNDIPLTFLSQFEGFIEEEMQAVIAGEEQLDNALTNLQQRSEEAVLLLKQQAEEEKASQEETAQSAAE